MNLKLVSRACLAIAGIIFVVYFFERLSASARVPIDLYSAQATTLFPLLLVMALFVGASFMIEAYIASK